VSLQLSLIHEDVASGDQEDDDTNVPTNASERGEQGDEWRICKHASRKEDSSDITPVTRKRRRAVNPRRFRTARYKVSGSRCNLTSSRWLLGNAKKVANFFILFFFYYTKLLYVNTKLNK
jgi:hypothetical protein